MCWLVMTRQIRRMTYRMPWQELEASLAHWFARQVHFAALLFKQA